MAPVPAPPASTPPVSPGPATIAAPPRLLKPGVMMTPLPLSESLRSQLRASKQRADMAAFMRRVIPQGGRIAFQMQEGRTYPLEPSSEPLNYSQMGNRLGVDWVGISVPSPAVMAWHEYWGGPPPYSRTPPRFLSRRPQQTPVRDQQDRGTCVAFAVTAAIEAQYGRPTLHLSEQWAFHSYKSIEGVHPCINAASPDLMVAVLKLHGQPLDRVFPYQTRAQMGCPEQRADGSLSGPMPAISVPPLALSGRAWAPGLFHRARRGDADAGNYANNPRYLEILLSQGHEPIVSVDVTDWSDLSQVIDVKLDERGEPLGGVGGHAMLLVGYSQYDSQPGQGYFVFKNSWGTGANYDGYVRLSYDYIRTYATSAVQIHGVNEAARVLDPDWQPGGHVLTGPVVATAPARAPVGQPPPVVPVPSLPAGAARPPIPLAPPGGPVPLQQRINQLRQELDSLRHPVADSSLHIEPDCVVNATGSGRSYVSELNVMYVVPPTSQAFQAPPGSPFEARLRCRSRACARSYGGGPDHVAEFPILLRESPGSPRYRLTQVLQQLATACRQLYGDRSDR